MPIETISTDGFTPLEKKGMAATFGGAGGALLSELCIRNGMDGPAAQASFVVGVVAMVGGCVALVLSEKKRNRG